MNYRNKNLHFNESVPLHSPVVAEFAGDLGRLIDAGPPVVAGG